MRASTRTLCVFALSAIAVLLCLTRPLRAQHKDGTPEGGFRFLPGSPLQLPLVASDSEPRVGLRKEIGSSRMDLDIGATFDLAEYASPDGVALRLGVDFFTYALTSSFSGHRLQVDAVDGFFGGHLLYRSAKAGRALVLRIRGLHRSAHFLDGHYDNALNQWRDGREPIPFTKDLADVLAAYTWDAEAAPVTIHAGLGYSTLIRPVEIERVAAVVGIELSSGSMLGTAFGRPFALFSSFNMSLDGIPETVGTSTVLAGVKFGEWDGQGVRLVVSYRSGLEMYGEYYDVRRTSWSLGILFDIW